MWRRTSFKILYLLWKYLLLKYKKTWHFLQIHLWHYWRTKRNCLPNKHPVTSTVSLLHKVSKTLWKFYENFRKEKWYFIVLQEKARSDCHTFNIIKSVHDGTEKCNFFCIVIAVINSKNLACNASRTWSRAKKNFHVKSTPDSKNVYSSNKKLLIRHSLMAVRNRWWWPVKALLQPMRFW